MKPKTLWIVGTSVSIEEGGYVSRLRARASELGVEIRNLSIGDQTSVMGYMRLLGHSDEVSAGDVVLWEYGLLDALLIESLFDAGDVHDARRRAWRFALARGATVVVLLVAPRKYLAARSQCEGIIAEEATACGLPCIDTRDLFAGLGVVDSEPHYRDDRHPRIDSPVIDAMVAAIEMHLQSPPRHVRPSALRARLTGREWRWLGAHDLARRSGALLTPHANALVDIDAVTLPVDAAVATPDMHRVVAIGIVSTHESGGIYCGHPGCPPASTRLPMDLAYSFLLRTTRLPCVRGSVKRLVSAPEYAYARGDWADYGQAPSRAPHAVAIFGLLYEPQTTHGLRGWIGWRS